MLALEGRAGQKLELAQGLRAERTHREIRLAAGGGTEAGAGRQEAAPEYEGTVPGEIDAPAFGVRLVLAVPGGDAGGGRRVTLRNWRAGDRVTLRYSSGPRKVKEVLERLRVTGTARSVWPVLEMDGRIVWMREVELQPEPGIAIEARLRD
jgi:tRNA(Ile)-lysidine synthase